ncbi:hypothetical protein AB1Y20_003319 [Prymnesium parvum]|uniref:Uncharacterized protein n=1 Tax=Prymnesium parvum TaxID=97485 RepID=A0AB34JBP2_PRYPA
MWSGAQRSLSPLLLAVALSSVARVSGQAGCGQTSQTIDLSTVSNPSVSVSFTNTEGNPETQGTYSGGFFILTAAETVFPNGYVRVANVGTGPSGAFDMIVRLSSTQESYDQADLTFTFSYALSGGTSVVLTENGLMCLGIGVQQSTCTAGNTLVASTATCNAGATNLRGAVEFNITMVFAGTLTQYPDFKNDVYFTGIDVDGDANPSNIFELISCV